MWIQLAVSVGIQLISAGVNYLFSSDEEEEKGIGPLDYGASVPEIKSSDAIPVVFGTVDITNPAAMWYKALYDIVGGERYKAVDGHFVLCQGPVDWVSEFTYGDRLPLYQTGQPASERVDPGTSVEGTDVDWHWHSGSPIRFLGKIYNGLQTTASAFDLLNVTDIPASLQDAASVGYRHVISLTGRLTGGAEGLAGFRIRVCRIYSRSYDAAPWYSSKLTTGSDGMNGRDMNPVHIIHDCLTDPIWGMGIPTSQIDDTAFQAAADKLYTEEIMLSAMLEDQGAIEEFIAEVLRYCNGVLYREPTTGKWTITIADDDYTVASLPLLDDSNSTAEDVLQYAKSLPTRVTVKYRKRDYRTDTTSYKPLSLETPESITNTDQHAYGKYGEDEVVQDYPMVKNATLASKLASRDLVLLTTPLLRVDLQAHWSAAKDLRPGDVFRWSSAELGVDEKVLRVTSIDLGTPTSKAVKIQALEDAFAFADPIYPPADDPEWDPYSAPAAAPDRLALELPLWLALQADLEVDPHAAATDYTSRTTGYAALAASRPSDDAIDYDLYTESTTKERGVGFSEVVTTTTDVAANGGGYTTIGWSEDVEFDDTHDLIFQLNTELVRCRSVDNAAKTMSVERGWGDTVPTYAGHAAGSKMYLLGELITEAGHLRFRRTHSLDRTAWADGDVVDLRALTRTPLGKLAVADAPIDSLTLDRRAHRPIVPAHVIIIDNSDPVEYTGSVDVYWSHRNRFKDPVGDDASSQSLESGTTYTLAIYDNETNTLLRTVTGLTGESYSYSNQDEKNDMGGSLASSLRFELHAERSGVTSWQTYIKEMSR